MKKILVVEDHEALRQGIVETFQRSGHAVSEAEDADVALRLIGEEFFPVIVTDLSLPRGSGLDVLRAAKQVNALTTVIVMTAYGTVENAVEAMRLGAEDYLQKPFPIEELEIKVSKALERQVLVQTLDDLRHTVGWPHQLVGTSPELRRLIGVIEKVAPGHTTVLLEGETGTGKELVANAIHAASPRASRNLVKVNCAAIPEHLQESELFGHERGAFTGADRQRIGRFELANGGTLFLDEIGELSLATQAKLLRVVQTQEFERVGGEKTIAVNVRLIAATNKTLEAEVKERRFRDDLFYRLNVMTLILPPLRERREDIPPLIHHFMKRYTTELGKEIRGMDPDALTILQGYAWPGNVRELENTIERAVLMAEGETIRQRDLSLGAAPTLGPSTGGAPLPDTPPAETGTLTRLDEVERQTIVAALVRSNWIQKDAAKVLGISPRVLNYKIKSHRLTHPTWIRHKPPHSEAA
jgi:two-component system response regulator PilR (NtrC family)